MSNHFAMGLWFLLSKITKHKPDNKPALYNNGITPATIKPFTFEITVEHDTIREQCAIDALMDVVKIDRDMYTYSGDTHAYAEYIRFTVANHKVIHKEENDRYKY